MKCRILDYMSETINTTQGISRKPGAFEKRIHEIDLIRGILIGLVLFDHLCWCLQYYGANWYYGTGEANLFFKWLFEVFSFYWTGSMYIGNTLSGSTVDFRDIVQFFALFGFTFLSGVSSVFSKNNWIRAGQMIAVFAVILVGSNILDASNLVSQNLKIDFNVIGVLAFSTLFYCFVHGKGFRMLVVGVLVMFLLSAYTIPWLEGTPASTANIPALFEPSNHADWMPLFPYIFFFFLGALFSYIFYAPTKQSLVKRRGNWERPFCFMGRHSLLIYLGHQFIMLPIFILITICLGIKL